MEIATYRSGLENMILNVNVSINIFLSKVVIKSCDAGWMWLERMKRHSHDELIEIIKILRYDMMQPCHFCLRPRHHHWPLPTHRGVDTKRIQCSDVRGFEQRYMSGCPLEMCSYETVTHPFK